MIHLYLYFQYNLTADFLLNLIFILYFLFLTFNSYFKDYFKYLLIANFGYHRSFF